MKSKSQTDQLFDLLRDGEPHSTLEILSVVYGVEFRGIARIASRVNDLKKRGYIVWGFKKDGIYHYQMEKVKASKPEVRIVERDGVLKAVLTMA